MRKELNPFTEMHTELSTAFHPPPSAGPGGLLGVEAVQDHGLELHSGTQASNKKLNGIRSLYFSVYKYFYIFSASQIFFCSGISFAMTVVCCRDTTGIELLLELPSSFPLKLPSP